MVTTGASDWTAYAETDMAGNRLCFRASGWPLSSTVYEDIRAELMEVLGGEGHVLSLSRGCAEGTRVARSTPVHAQGRH